MSLRVVAITRIDRGIVTPNKTSEGPQSDASTSNRGGAPEGSIMNGMLLHHTYLLQERR
jgi:hypothetical protein